MARTKCVAAAGLLPSSVTAEGSSKGWPAVRSSQTGAVELREDRHSIGLARGGLRWCGGDGV
jgi:hypothetical protein